MPTQRFTLGPRRGTGPRTLDVAVVGGPVDGFTPRIRDADRTITFTPSGQALLSFALLGHGKFQPLRTDATGASASRPAAEVAAPIDERTVEVHVFTGYREVGRRLGRARRLPVFAHVDTRPLRVGQREGQTVIGMG